MAFASRTGTRRNLAAIRAAGWGLLVSATGAHRTEGFAVYALDNGAWSAYQSGEAWAALKFVLLVVALGSGAAFIVLPDIVGGGAESLRLSLDWLPVLRWYGVRLLIPVQDGMQPEGVAPYLDEQVGIFVGGTTEWKLATMAMWAQLARECGAYCHVGRVNTAKRIKQCQLAGVDSFDGTSASRFATTLPMLDSARRQTAWIL